MKATLRRGPFRSLLSGAATCLALVAIVFFGLVFALPDEVAKAQVYTMGFLAAFVAAVVWGVDAVRRRGERLTVLPTTTLGRWVVGLMLASALLQFAGTGLQFVAPIFSYGPLIGFALAFVAVVVGVTAVFRRGERSVVVLVLTAFPAAFLLYFFIGEFLFPH